MFNQYVRSSCNNKTALGGCHEVASTKGNGGLFVAVLIWLIGAWYLQVYIDSNFPWVALFGVLNFVYFMLMRPRLWISEAFIGVYSIFLGLALSVSSFLGSGNELSVLRALASSGFLFISYVLVYRFLLTLLGKPSAVISNVNHVMSILFLSFIFGFIFLEGFGGGFGGFRLSGGINPNAVGFFSYMSLVWVVLVSRLSYGWTKSSIFLLFLSMLVLLWSGSRASILAGSIFIATMAVFAFFKLICSWRLSKNVIKIPSVFLVVVVVFSFTANILTSGVFFEYIGLRIVDPFSSGGDSNFSSRLNAWVVLLERFNDSPVYGVWGWYNATRVLNGLGEGVAESPHSLYVRLLSEVGLIGLASVVVLPFGAMIFGLAAIYKTSGSWCPRPSLRDHQINYASVVRIAISGLAGIFLGREFFEDSYLTGYLSFTTVFSMFLVAVILRRFRFYVQRF